MKKHLLAVLAIVAMGIASPLQSKEYKCQCEKWYDLALAFATGTQSYGADSYEADRRGAAWTKNKAACKRYCDFKEKPGDVLD